MHWRSFQPALRAQALKLTASTQGPHSKLCDHATSTLVSRVLPSLLFQAPRLLSLSCFRAFNHGSIRQGEQKPRFNPSHEQQEVIRLCFTQNVVVSARPGSGKTATAEAIVASNPDKRSVILTYTKQLQLETSKRLQKHSNCSVLTFHGMASTLFGDIVCNDSKLWEQRRRTLDYNKLPQWPSAAFDIIILDEFQDCTELLFWLVQCFILANNQKRHGQPARLVILGDERQSIHQFRGADHRYLTRAPQLLSSISPYPFATVPLAKSFRLSDQTVQFINHGFLDGESYIASKTRCEACYSEKLSP